MCGVSQCDALRTIPHHLLHAPVPLESMHDWIKDDILAQEADIIRCWPQPPTSATTTRRGHGQGLIKTLIIDEDSIHGRSIEENSAHPVKRLLGLALLDGKKPLPSQLAAEFTILDHSLITYSSDGNQVFFQHQLF